MLNSNEIKSEKFYKLDRIVLTFHGYGASGDDFAEVGKLFMAKYLENTVFLFPNAPYICETGFGRKWFTLDKMSYEELREGLEKTSPIVSDYIQSISEKYGCKNINLIGFSQGAMLAFEMLYYRGISKIVAYSGVFAQPVGKMPLSNAEVLIVHSDDDEVVPYKNATFAKNNLDNIGIKSELKTYHSIGHSISIDAWKYGMEFLNKSTTIDTNT